MSLKDRMEFPVGISDSGTPFPVTEPGPDRVKLAKGRKRLKKVKKAEPLTDG